MMLNEDSGFPRSRASSGVGTFCIFTVLMCHLAFASCVQLKPLLFLRATKALTLCCRRRETRQGSRKRCSEMHFKTHEALFPT